MEKPDNWKIYHKTKDELKKSLSNHLKSIDLVFIYDNKITMVTMKLIWKLYVHQKCVKY